MPQIAFRRSAGAYIGKIRPLLPMANISADLDMNDSYYQFQSIALSNSQSIQSIDHLSYSQCTVSRPLANTTPTSFSALHTYRPSSDTFTLLIFKLLSSVIRALKMKNNGQRLKT